MEKKKIVANPKRSQEVIFIPSPLLINLHLDSLIFFQIRGLFSFIVFAGAITEIWKCAWGSILWSSYLHRSKVTTLKKKKKKEIIYEVLKYRGKIHQKEAMLFILSCLFPLNPEIYNDEIMPKNKQKGRFWYKRQGKRQRKSETKK